MNSREVSFTNLTQREWTRFWNKVKGGSKEECWLWQSAMTHNNYGTFEMRGVSLRAHRVAYALTFGKVPEGMCVRHKCDNSICCNPNHLLLGTVEDNIADQVLRKRHAAGDRNGTKTHPERVVRGERQKFSKLTNEIVAKIRGCSKSITSRKLAKEFGVDVSTICSCRNGKTWRHVK